MYKFNITERTGNHPNENLPAWYKEKVKVMAEIIVKKELSKGLEIAPPLLTYGGVPPCQRHAAGLRPFKAPRNDAHRELEVVVK